MALKMVEDTRRLILGGNPGELADIPEDGMFEDNGDSKFLPAFEARRIGQALIEARPELEHLAGVDIRYEWARKGGSKAGRATLGTCRRASGLIAYYSRADFIVCLSADNCRDARFTRWQLEALVYHELRHADLDPDHGTPMLQGHDVEMFTSEVERYGLWRQDLRTASVTFVQLELGQS